MHQDQLTKIVDALLLTAEKPLSIDKLLHYFHEGDDVNRADLTTALESLTSLTEDRGFTLTKTASGYRYQSRDEYRQWVGQHWQEKTPRYSRAFLETLALIIYRQPITRAEIEEVRGVAVSSNIIKSLQEREWIRIVGHKEVPGRPAMLGTTRQLLDYFNLESLDNMPPLTEIQDIDKLYPELAIKTPDSANDDKVSAEERDATDKQEPPQ
ncbi:MAG: Segregation and condensation protein B [uncultured Thiotrichaceae bacterium]|uniref:Segregation and condensation protein B n=1 Tax=uncultured Thiotrichaceae bacterium TaxID=298394 RepID=A0A6S6TTD3_9GAMM|nr:MAG: Segregation and condensation protein B [uncultured Thiotrichaceae bacterium]